MPYSQTIRDEVFERLGVYVSWWYQLAEMKGALGTRIDEAVADFNIKNVEEQSDEPSDADMRAYEALSAEVHRQQQTLDSLRYSVVSAVSDFLGRNVKDLIGSPESSPEDILDDLTALMEANGDSVLQNTVAVADMEESPHNSVTVADGLALPTIASPTSQLVRNDVFSLVCSDDTAVDQEQWTLRSGLIGEYSGEIATGQAADWDEAGIEGLMVMVAPVHGKVGLAKVSNWYYLSSNMARGTNVSADGRLWAKFHTKPDPTDENDTYNQVSNWAFSAAVFGSGSDVDGKLHVSVVKDPPEATATHNTAVLTGISLTGASASNTSDGTLYATVSKSGADYTVALYRDAARTELKASGTGSTLGVPITLNEQNSSGLSGSATVYSYVADDNTIQVQVPRYYVRLYRAPGRAEADLFGQGVSYGASATGLSFTAVKTYGPAGTVDLNYSQDDEDIELTVDFYTVDLYRADPSDPETTEDDIVARAGSRLNLLDGQEVEELPFFEVNGNGLPLYAVDVTAATVSDGFTASAAFGYSKGDTFTFRTTSDDAGRFQTFLRDAFTKSFPPSASPTVSDDLAEGVGGASAAGVGNVLTFAIPYPWVCSTQGTEREGVAGVASVWGDCLKAEFANADVKRYDVGTDTCANIRSSLTGWQDRGLLPDAGTQQVGDRLLIAFGTAAYTSFPVFRVYGPPQCATWSAAGGKWQYSTAAGWADMGEFWDNSDTSDPTAGTMSLQVEGAICFAPGADWAARTIDGVTAKWISYVLTDTTLTGVPLVRTDVNPVCHSPSVPGYGNSILSTFVLPCSLTIEKVGTRVGGFDAATMQATVPGSGCRFALVNLTKMACSEPIAHGAGLATQLTALDAPLEWDEGDRIWPVVLRDEGGYMMSPFCGVTVELHGIFR